MDHKVNNPTFSHQVNDMCHQVNRSQVGKVNTSHINPEMPCSKSPTNTRCCSCRPLAGTPVLALVTGDRVGAGPRRVRGPIYPGRGHGARVVVGVGAGAHHGGRAWLRRRKQAGCIGGVDRTCARSRPSLCRCSSRTENAEREKRYYGASQAARPQAGRQG